MEKSVKNPSNNHIPDGKMQQFILNAYSKSAFKIKREYLK